MAAATAIAIGSTLYSGYQAYNSSKEKESAKRALDGLAKPVNVNVADGLQVSTLGANMRREEQGRVSASEVDALRGSGTRGIIGGVGAVDAQNKATEQSIAANLDEQQKNIDIMKANDNIRLQGIEENRYQRNVAGLSSQINASNAEMNQGIANTLVSGADAAAKIDEWLARKKGKGSGDGGIPSYKNLNNKITSTDLTTKQNAPSTVLSSISSQANPNAGFKQPANLNTTDKTIIDEFGNQVPNPYYKGLSSITGKPRQSLMSVSN